MEPLYTITDEIDGKMRSEALTRGFALRLLDLAVSIEYEPCSLLPGSSKGRVSTPITM